MGTIAQKLEYLNDTRLLLKDNINKINNVLDDNSTFRSYPQELFNGYLDILNNGTDTLWNNLEKVSASGEEATLENVETAPIKMVLNGNTSQETTTGKNLFDQTTNQFFNVSRVTWGTNISQIVDLLNSLNEGQYALSYKVKFDSLDSQISGERNIGFLIINSVSGNINTRRNETVRINEIYNVEGIITITASNKGSFTNCYIYSRSGTGGTQDYTTTYDVQLEQGSPTSYEPYTGSQPSPNPDYPQEVKVVKGENVVSVSGKNLQEMLFTDGSSNGIEWHIESDGSIIINGTTTSSVAIRYTRSDLMPVVEGKTYTLSATGMENIGNFGYKNSGTGKDIAVVTTSSPSLTFEATSNMITQANRLDLYIRADKTFVNQKVTLQLEEGSTASEYTPFSKTDYPINLGDIELCKINTYKDYFHKDSGKWYKYKAINKILIKNIEGYTEEKGIRVTAPKYDIPVKAYPNLYSNYFKEALNYGGSVDGKNKIGINLNGNILTSISGYTNINQYKTFFTNNDVYIYYPLATPTEEEITNTTLIEQLEAISKAKSVKDKTYITQTNDGLPFILDVEAIKEYEVN